jgi:hypothetical protein
LEIDPHHATFRDSFTLAGARSRLGLNSSLVVLQFELLSSRRSPTVLLAWLSC